MPNNNRFEIYDEGDLRKEINALMSDLVNLALSHHRDGETDSSDYLSEYSALRAEFGDALMHYVQQEREDYSSAGEAEGYAEGRDDGVADGREEVLHSLESLVERLEAVVPVAVDAVVNKYYPPTYDALRVRSELETLHDAVIAVRLDS